MKGELNENVISILKMMILVVVLSQKCIVIPKTATTKTIKNTKNKLCFNTKNSSNNLLECNKSKTVTKIRGNKQKTKNGNNINVLSANIVVSI